MNSETLTRSLREHAVSKGIAIIGFTNANPVECLPWSVDAQPGRYTPCNTQKLPTGYMIRVLSWKMPIQWL